MQYILHAVVSICLVNNAHAFLAKSGVSCGATCTCKPSLGNGGGDMWSRQQQNTQLHSGKMICFKASKIIRSEPIAAQGVNLNGAFASDDAVASLFPGVLSFEKCGNDIYKVALPMSSFPGVTITTHNYFTIVRGNELSPSLSVNLLNSTSVATGPKALVAIVNASMAKSPKTSGTNIVTAVAHELSSGAGIVLSSSVSLSIGLEIPLWLPIPAKVLEKKGSAAIQRLIESDMEPKLESLRIFVQNSAMPVKI